MTDAVLSRLKKGPLSGTQLAHMLGLTRAAVHKRVNRLRAQGQRIVGTPRAGYRWVGESVRNHFSSLTEIGVSRVVHRRVATSTQEVAKGLALRGAPEGTFVVADRQTAGRGRLGRRWESPLGGLWYSLLLRPPLRPDEVPALSLVAALDWARELRARGVSAGVKWPNDVWIDGKKVAGILCDMSAESDRVEWVVVGVGVNVNNAPSPELANAASIRAWTGVLDREALLKSWVERFFPSYTLYGREGFAPFRRDYESISVLHNEPVTFESAAGPCRGTVLGVDERGRLRLATGRDTHLLMGGDIFLVRPAGSPRKKTEAS